MRQWRLHFLKFPMLPDLAEIFTIINMSQDMLHKGMNDIQTMNLIASGDWQIKRYNGYDIRFRYAQRRVQTCKEFRQLIEANKLSSLRVVSVYNYSHKLCL